MRFPLAIVLLAFSLTACTEASGALITTLNFADAATWQTTLASTGGTNDSNVAGGTINLGKSGGAGGNRITVDLIGSIPTVGFENITIAFDALADTDFEYNANLTAPVASSDGFLITGSGVSIGGDVDSVAGVEAEFEAGTTFPSALFQNGTTVGGAPVSFEFATSADNSSITSLTFVLQTNANAEDFTLSNVQILGDVIAVPEPASFAALAFCGLGVVIRRRRRA